MCNFRLIILARMGSSTKVLTLLTTSSYLVGANLLRAVKNEYVTVEEKSNAQIMLAEWLGGAYFDMDVEPGIAVADDAQDTSESAISAHGHLDYSSTPLQGQFERYFASINEETSERDLVWGRDTSMFTTLLEGDLIAWDSTDGDMKISAYNSIFSMDNIHNEIDGLQWTYVTAPLDSNQLETTILEEPRQNFVAFLLWGTPSNLFYSHILPILAYLRETTHPKTKFILIDNASRSNYAQLEAVDAEFARNRVIWIACRSNQCNHRVQIRAGGTLDVIRPPVTLRHGLFKSLARQWIQQQQVYPINTPSVVIYYSQPNLPLDQQSALLEMVKHASKPAQVQVLDETMPLVEQVTALGSAHAVLGVNSFRTPNFSPLFVSNQTKVLEFVDSPSDTFYELYSSFPWIEYHYVLAKLDFRELDQALKAIFN